MIHLSSLEDRRYDIHLSNHFSSQEEGRYEYDTSPLAWSIEEMVHLSSLEDRIYDTSL
jgi:hypothetical protein